MKTPEEIKKGLECYRPKYPYSIGRCPEGCPYEQDDAYCRKMLNMDGLTYIQQLETHLAQTERERDAAVRDMKSVDEKYEVLKSMIDDVVFRHEPYGVYLDFREAADAMIEHEHEDVWRGPCPENTKEEPPQ